MSMYIQVVLKDIYIYIYPLFRLHSHTLWAAGSNDVFQWIQVKFGQRVIIRAVSTQGRHTSYNQWVKSYSLNYSSDGLSFRRYQNNKHLTVSIFQTFYHVLIMGGIRLFSFSQEGIDHKVLDIFLPGLPLQLGE